jgi:hypothetical protein
MSINSNTTAPSSGTNVKLVVVDVSTEDARFKLRNGSPLVPAVLQVMESSAFAGQQIFVLRYAGERSVKTDAGILTFLRGYDRGREIERQIPDGSEEISDALGTEAIVDIFRLCGTFGDASISATAYGLAERYPNARIEVLIDASIAALGTLGWYDSYLAAPWPNVVLVRSDGSVITTVEELRAYK